MKIIDDALLTKFRDRRVCEHCRRPGPVHVHHLHAKGMGGGSRVDKSWNLCSLCATCHGMVHDGNISRAFILEIVAARERITVAEIGERIGQVRRGEAG